MEDKNKPRTNQRVTLRSLINQGKQTLIDCHKEDASIDSELLGRYLLGYTKLEMILKANTQISQEDKKRYDQYIAQRCSGIPLQYITNEQEFMGLSFYVDKNVLIPRQDTESLVELLIEKSKHKAFRNIIEVGVGSGCISISLAKFLPQAKITGIDISSKALAVAKKNAIKHGVDDRINWLQADLLSHDGQGQKADLIVSNPPYITSKDCSQLERDVKDHEPMLALDGGKDGLEFYRKITKQAKSYLAQAGVLAYEIGYNQSKDVQDIMQENGFIEIEAIKDLANKDRVVLGIWNDPPTKETKR